MRYTLTPDAPLSLADAPVTLAEAKAWANVTHTTDDALLTSLILAVSEQVEDITGLSFAARAWTYTALADRAAFATAIELPRRPVASVESVTSYAYDDAETLMEVGTDYHLGRAQTITLRGLAMQAGGAVVVGFTTAKATVPPAVKTAVLRGVDQHYTWRNDVVGAGGAMRLPQGAMNLLLPHRRLSV